MQKKLGDNKNKSEFLSDSGEEEKHGKYLEQSLLYYKYSWNLFLTAVQKVEI